SGIRISSAVLSMFRLLREELAEQTLFVLVFDAGEELVAERVDCLCTVEGQALIQLAAGEVAGRAAGLKERSDLCGEIYLRSGGRGGRRRRVRAGSTCRRRGGVKFRTIMRVELRTTIGVETED